MDSNERIKEVCQKIIKVKTALQDLESSVDAVHLLLSADHSMWLLQSEFDDLRKQNETLKSQLAALKIEHNELEKEHSDRGLYLTGKEKEIANLQDAIEKAVIAIWNTKSIFGKFSPKSGTLARIREDLTRILPVKIYDELRRFMSYRNLPPTGPPERKSVIIGYQPKSDNLDKTNPPQGGSGLK